ncbi:hypothetical protein, partial [Sandarakinorhabdus sp.]|uniref:hypothetical protein n=1 Tax=Sandarakinorhabdus sp. TaxID=1916663 RepID=UPI00286E1421
MRNANFTAVNAHKKTMNTGLRKATGNEAFTSNNIREEKLFVNRMYRNADTSGSICCLIRIGVENVNAA